MTMQLRNRAREVLYYSILGFRRGAQTTFMQVWREQVGPLIERYPEVADIFPGNTDPGQMSYDDLVTAAMVWQYGTTARMFVPAMTEPLAEGDGSQDDDEAAEFTREYFAIMVAAAEDHQWCDQFPTLSAILAVSVDTVLPDTDTARAQLAQYHSMRNPSRPQLE